MSKGRQALRAERALPPLTSLMDLMEWIAVRIDCEDAPAGYKPREGWHTIDVATSRFGEEPDEGCLRTWARLFNMYAENRRGTLYWKTVPYLNRQKGIVSAEFCIDARPRNDT